MDGRVLDIHRGDKIDFAVPALPLPDTTKSTGGYQLAPGMDWIDLFTGSEGTLGIVIEAELQLLPAPLPAPHDVLAGIVFLPSDGAALDAVDAWCGIPGLRMIEYFDANSLEFLRPHYSEIPGGAGAAVLIEQEDGDIDFWACLLYTSDVYKRQGRRPNPPPGPPPKHQEPNRPPGNA